MNDWASPWESNPPTPPANDQSPQHAAPPSGSAFPLLDSFVNEASWGHDDAPATANGSLGHEVRESPFQTTGAELVPSQWSSYPTAEAFPSSKINTDSDAAAGVPSPVVWNRVELRDQDNDYGGLPWKDDRREDTLLDFADVSTVGRLDGNDSDLRTITILSDLSATLQGVDSVDQDHHSDSNQTSSPEDLRGTGEREENKLFNYVPGAAVARLDEDNRNTTFPKHESASIASILPGKQDGTQSGNQNFLLDADHTEEDTVLGPVDQRTNSITYDAGTTKLGLTGQKDGTRNFGDVLTLTSTTELAAQPGDNGSNEVIVNVTGQTGDDEELGAEPAAATGSSSEETRSTNFPASKSPSPSSQIDANSPPLSPVVDPGTPATLRTSIDEADSDYQSQHRSSTQHANITIGDSSSNAVAVDDFGDSAHPSDTESVASFQEVREQEDGEGGFTDPTEAKISRLAQPVRETSDKSSVGPAGDAQPTPTLQLETTIDVSNELIRSLFPALLDQHGQHTDPVPDHLISTTSTRKAWYRLTRPGPSRQHASADLDNYIRVTWRGSAIQARVADTVAGWVSADRATGGAVFNPSVVTRGQKPFRWSEKDEVAGGSKPESETSLKSTFLAPPPPAGKLGFGWSSEASSKQEKLVGPPTALDGIGPLRSIDLRRSQKPVAAGQSATAVDLSSRPTASQKTRANQSAGEDGLGLPEPNGVGPEPTFIGTAAKSAKPVPDPASDPFMEYALQDAPPSAEADPLDDFGSFLSAASPAPRVASSGVPREINGTGDSFGSAQLVPPALLSQQGKQTETTVDGFTNADDWFDMILPPTDLPRDEALAKPSQNKNIFAYDQPRSEIVERSSHYDLKLDRPPNPTDTDSERLSVSSPREEITINDQLNPPSPGKINDTIPTAPLPLLFRQASDLGEWFSNIHTPQTTPPRACSPAPLSYSQPSTQPATPCSPEDRPAVPPSLQPSNILPPAPIQSLPPGSPTEAPSPTTSYNVPAPTLENHHGLEDFGNDLDNGFGQFISSPALRDDGFLTKAISPAPSHNVPTLLSENHPGLDDFDNDTDTGFGHFISSPALTNDTFPTKTVSPAPGRNIPTPSIENQHDLEAFDNDSDPGFGQFVSSPALRNDGFPTAGEAHNPGVNAPSSPHTSLSHPAPSPPRSDDWDEFFAAQLPQADAHPSTENPVGKSGTRPSSGMDGVWKSSATESAAAAVSAAEGPLAGQVDHEVVRAVVRGLPNLLYML